MARNGVIAATLMSALASCGDDVKSDSAADSVPAEGVPYSTVDKLVEAGRDAGIDCPYVNTPLRQRLAADSRYCSSDPDGNNVNQVDFSIYVSKDDQQKALREAEQFARGDIRMGLGTPASVLVGPNWLIEGPLDELEKASESMGGVVQNLENIAVD